MRLIFMILLTALLVSVVVESKDVKTGNKAEGSGQETDECKDQVNTCNSAKIYCQNYKLKNLLKQNCKKTCGLCGQVKCADNNNQCKYWIKNGYCNSVFYTQGDKEYSCRKGCGFCK